MIQALSVWFLRATLIIKYEIDVSVVPEVSGIVDLSNFYLIVRIFLSKRRRVKSLMSLLTVVEGFFYFTLEEQKYG